MESRRPSPLVDTLGTRLAFVEGHGRRTTDGQSSSVVVMRGPGPDDVVLARRAKPPRWSGGGWRQLPEVDACAIGVEPATGEPVWPHLLSNGGAGVVERVVL